MANVTSPDAPPLPQIPPPESPPLLVCPPAFPPPSPPPDFSVWSQSVPAWFWFSFVVILLFACAGCAAMVYVLRELKMMKQRGMKLAGTDTGRAMDELSRRVRNGRV